jgi:hypothetical protein
MIFLHSLWLIFPAIAGGAAHIAVIKLNLFPALARVPLDLELRFRGRRVFGTNKTLRGFIVMPAATALFSVLQATSSPPAPLLSPPGFDRIDPLLWGLALGFGYVLGELPNSFVKRQLDIPPGSSASGRLKYLFWVFDQVDGLVGALPLMYFLWAPSVAMIVPLVILALIIHPLMAIVMVRLGLKRNIV